MSNPGGYALAADGLTVEQSVFCRDGFAAPGEVCLVGAHVRGSVDFDGATMSDPAGCALNAGGLSVDGDLSGRAEFAVDGEVRLVGAHVGGTLSFSRTTVVVVGITNALKRD